MGNKNNTNSKKYDMAELKVIAIDMLKRRGVELIDIAEIVQLIQIDYHPDLSLEKCLYNVDAVLSKREVIHCVLTGIAIDELAEKKLLPEPLQSIIASDESLYGLDEILPLSIVNIYGTIGLTNFGYLDKEKIGIIKKLDTQQGGKCNTFLDDIVAGISAAAASRIAHAK